MLCYYHKKMLINLVHKCYLISITSTEDITDGVNIITTFINKYFQVVTFHFINPTSFWTALKVELIIVNLIGTFIEDLLPYNF